MNIFRKKKPKIQAFSASVKSYPGSSRPLVQTVIENWEAPASEQYDHAFEEYLANLAEPTFELVKARRAKTVLLVHTIERMRELAPDFYEQAISHAGLNQQNLIERRSDDDPTHQ